jgi:hypothetical protein
LSISFQTLSPFRHSDLRLPNSVALLADGNLIVADGGSDGIFNFSPSGELLQKVSGTGFSKYEFRQPVAVSVSPLQDILVADWHNHRIVVYDRDLTYKGEFGGFGNPRRVNGRLIGAVRDKVRRSRVCLSNPPYTLNHHGGEIKRSSIPDGLTKKIRRLAYLVSRHTISVGTVDLNKPNGMAFIGSRLYVTQKNARCVSVFERTAKERYKLLASRFGPSQSEEFGRLGNLSAASDGRLYVCDEHRHVIWVLDSNLEYLGRLTCSEGDRGEFFPFACCQIDEEHLAVCGGLTFQIIDTITGEVTYRHSDIGELHGIAYDGRRSILYLSSRKEGMICRFSLKTV